MFDHEKLDIYRVSLEFAAWSYRLCKMLKGSDRHARDQILRASQSIPQNVAEGTGKRSGPDRRRFFEIARGSALECASILDILVACEALTEAEAAPGKGMLLRIVAMLSKMTAGDQVGEEACGYGAGDYDYENEHRFAEHEHDKEGESEQVTTPDAPKAARR